jgi:iron complex outermembrane receptor protein
MAGGSHVVSEKLIAFELGWRHQLTAGFTLSLATFYNAYDDLRSLEPLNPPARFPVEASTGLEGHSSGAELTADWRIAPTWRLRAGYTELRVHSEPQPGSLDRATRGSIARDPNHQFHLRSLWDISTTWECDVDLRYVSSIGIHSVPGYTEACVRLGWTPAPRWEISVTGQNLLHSRHSEFYPPGSRRAIERGVHAQVSWRY